MLPDRDFAPLLDKCLFLAGPTASGKSEVSLALADALDAEILSLDSIAVYRWMDIGTAKPTAEQRRLIPHHLLDLADPSEEFSISRYLTAAHEAVAEVRRRGKLPMFVGGTPLYMKGLLRGFFVGPPADWEFRRAVQQDVETYGEAALHERLRQVDPLAAHKLPTGDTRRMIRALEVAYLTGRPLSHWQVQFDAPTLASNCAVFALRIDRPRLRARIDRRVDWMFASGLVAEVEGILTRAANPAVAFGRTAAQAVGYRETLAYLNNEIDLATAQSDVHIHTRQLAKRQESWLRSLEEVEFIDVAPEQPADQIAAEILSRGEARIAKLR